MKELFRVVGILMARLRSIVAYGGLYCMFLGVLPMVLIYGSRF